MYSPEDPNKLEVTPEEAPEGTLEEEAEVYEEGEGSFEEEAVPAYEIALDELDAIPEHITAIIESDIEKLKGKVQDESGATEPTEAEILELQEQPRERMVSAFLERHPTIKMAVTGALLSTIMAFAEKTEAGVSFNISEPEEQVTQTQSPQQQASPRYGESDKPTYEEWYRSRGVTPPSQTYQQPTYEERGGALEQASEKEVKEAQKWGFKDGKSGVANKSKTEYWQKYKTAEERAAYNYGWDQGSEPKDYKEQKKQEKQWNKQAEKEQKRLDKERKKAEKEAIKDSKTRRKGFEKVVDHERGIRRGKANTKAWMDMIFGAP